MWQPRLIRLRNRPWVCAHGKQPAVRKALTVARYMPALVAVRHDPHVRAYYEHLLARGKSKMQALIATMRAVYGMFKHDQLFDGQKVYNLTKPALAPALPNSEVVCLQT